MFYLLFTISSYFFRILLVFFVNMVFFEPLRKILIILIILCHSDTAFMNGCYFQGNTLIRPEELLPLDSARNPRTNQGKPGLPAWFSCWKMKAALQTFWKRQRMPRSGTDYIKNTGYSSVWKRTAIPPAEREGLFHSLEGSLSLFLTKINSDCPALSQLQ